MMMMTEFYLCKSGQEILYHIEIETKQEKL